MRHKGFFHFFTFSPLPHISAPSDDKRVSQLGKGAGAKCRNSVITSGRDPIRGLRVFRRLMLYDSELGGGLVGVL